MKPTILRSREYGASADVFSLEYGDRAELWSNDFDCFLNSLLKDKELCARLLDHFDNVGGANSDPSHPYVFRHFLQLMEHFPESRHADRSTGTVLACQQLSISPSLRRDLHARLKGL
ncbi:hypothetical protein HKCCE2091_10950 [Rhodobacterales bacterium HKCCE2091]|nr:hypothetical protein [Rhodobacterales bacterium HKCCE2091]